MKSLLLFVALILGGCTPRQIPITEGDVSSVSIRYAKADVWVDYQEKGYIQIYSDYIIFTHPEGLKYVVRKEDVRDIRIKTKKGEP
jgi:hypothetical protein